MINFLNIDSSTIFKTQIQADTQADTHDEQKPDNQEETVKTSATNKNGIDWKKELEQRLAANKRLSAEAQEPEFKIESKFWSEFFNTIFEKNIAEYLCTIELLKDDIKTLGFDKAKNQILAFLSLDYVKTKLLATKLINSNTYKAIHNAIAKKYIAKSEFFTANDYNIIYCADLYTKPVVDIISYLAVQSKVLPANSSRYSKEKQEKNKRIFLQTYQKTIKADDAELKSLTVIEKQFGIKAEKTHGEAGPQKRLAVTKADLDEFSASPAHIFTTLQYLSIAAQSNYAAELLARDEFNNITKKELTTALKTLADKLNKYHFTKDSAKDIAAEIIKNL